MPELTLNLMDGFDKDRVHVKINGKTALDTVASTLTQAGVAHVQKIQTEDTRVNLEIVIAGRDISYAGKIDVGQTGHVGVSIEKGVLKVNARSSPFYHM